MRRLTILLATVAALSLVPVAQAAANGTLTVVIAGTGSGEISSVGGLSEVKPGGWEGSPPIECSGPPTSGTCETELVEDEELEEGVEAIALHEVPDPGSEFVAWEILEGEPALGCGPGGVSKESKNCVVYQVTGAGDAFVIAYFDKEPANVSLTVTKKGSGAGTVTSFPVGISCGPACPSQSAEFKEGKKVTLTATPAGSKFTGWTGCESEPEAGKCIVTMTEAKEVTAKFSLPGPTNLRTLTVTKSPSSSTGGGNGSVSSKPKGIKCGATCDEAVAAMYKNTPVELTAKPSTGSTFVKWENAKEGGTCDGSSSPTCTVPMSEDTELQAVFGGTSKAFSPAEALTVSKGESSGKGTVKGPGLGCEAECTSTVVLFQGPITEPKAKPGKTVVLKQAPAFGSTFSGWSGCDSETEAGECVVEMDEAHSVSAEYDALPNKVLTVNKEYAKGNGSVSSKPKGIKCGTTCTQAVAQMPEGAAVELTAKPSTGTFVKWEGGDCAGSTNPVCIVTMNTDETTKAVFSDPGKAIAEAKTLTLNKAGSGYGTVKAAGLGCEVLCSSTSVLYQGPITEPKAKPGKTVILKAVSAPGSKTVVWTGCDSIDGEGNCVVEMDENHSVTATFDELE